VIVETVVTTLDETGTPNFAAMGVAWGETTLTIRPFTNTRTYRNLLRTEQAVVNVTDDVLVFTKSALSRVSFPWFPASAVDGAVLEDTCSWREVRMLPTARTGDGEVRVDVVTTVVGGGTLRPFAGLCRAKHAVVEAGIIASRLRFIGLDAARRELERLATLVQKTGDAAEREAMDFVHDYVARWAGARAAIRR
jgi:hypothetical protein